MDKCPDCRGDLENGCMMDSTYLANNVQRYAKGIIPIPETPHKLLRLNEIDFNDIRKVIVYRCTKCNRLFSYAQEIVERPNLRVGVSYKNIMVLFFGILFMILIFGFLSFFFS